MKMHMKLLGDVRYCIKVDYFMWDSQAEKEYKKPMYLAIDTETKDKNGIPADLIMFEENITANLRVFDTEAETEKYIRVHNDFCMWYDNKRIVAIRYNFETKEWEEC